MIIKIHAFGIARDILKNSINRMWILRKEQQLC